MHLVHVCKLVLLMSEKIKQSVPLILQDVSTPLGS